MGTSMVLWLLLLIFRYNLVLNSTKKEQRRFVEIQFQIKIAGYVDLFDFLVSLFKR